MAKIEMDLSEYQEILKNKELLEESKKELKKVYEDNKKLQEEKIEALKQNEKCITVVKRTETSEYIMNKRPMEDALDFFRRSREGYYLQSDYNRIVDSIFEKNKMESHPPIEEITTRGLEEVKEELRAEIVKNFENEIKQLKGRNSFLESEVKTVEKNSERYKIDLLFETTELKTAIRDIQMLSEENLKYEEYIEYLEDSLNKYNSIKAILKNRSVTIFNFSRIISNIKSKLI